MGEKEKGKKSHMWTVLKTFHILKSLPLLNYFLTLSLLFPLCKEAGTQQSFPDTHVCKLLDKLDQQRVLAKFRQKLKLPVVANAQFSHHSLSFCASPIPCIHFLFYIMQHYGFWIFRHNSRSFSANKEKVLIRSFLLDGIKYIRNLRLKIKSIWK